MKMKIATTLACALVVSAAPMVQAIDITIFDGMSSGAVGTVWGPQENNELEPNVSPSPNVQIWDLEKFDLTGNNLTIQSGYNTVVGENGGLSVTYRPGDIFFASSGSALYGAGAPAVGGNGTVLTKNVWGYNYVINFGRNANGSLNGTYSVLAIDANTMLWDVSLNYTDGSNPWKYGSGAVRTISTGNTYGFSSFVDGEGTHYNLTVDVGFLAGSGYLAHYTYECGNDSLMGKVPDGGLTVVLLGFSLASIGLLRRKLF